MAYDARLSFLESVIDGEMLVQKFQAPGAAEPVVVHRSADLSDRLAAMKELRAVGLGTAKELTAESVRDRNALTRDTIRTDLPRMIRAMAPGAVTTVANEVLPLETPEDVAAALDKMLALHWVK